MTATTRRKLAGVLMAAVIFGCLGAVTTAAVGRPIEIGTMNAILIGAGIGLFEEFYVQGPRGNAIRAMHPMHSIFIYILAVMVLYLVAPRITHVVLGRLDDLPVVYRRLPYGLAFFAAFSIVGILMMRVAHFIGLRTLLDLVIGTYHRPVQERKVLLFLDINGSTALSERLGALTMRAFVHKFLSDLSQPIRRPGRRHLSLQGRWPDRDLELGRCVQQRCHLAGARCDARCGRRRTRSL